MDKYYVYALIDPRTNEPFYIGKGCPRDNNTDTRERMYEHERMVYNGKVPNKTNGKLYRYIKEMNQSNTPITYEKYGECMPEIEAYALEAAYIQWYGLRNLCNIVEGGGGINPYTGPNRDIVIDKIKRTTSTPEYKKMISDRTKEGMKKSLICQSDEYKHKMSYCWMYPILKQYGSFVNYFISRE